MPRFDATDPARKTGPHPQRGTREGEGANDERSSTNLGESLLTVMSGLEYIEPRTAVQIHGIKAKPELNGKRGMVMGYAPERMRYRVRIDVGEGTGGKESEEVYLKPENVIAVKTKEEKKVKEPPTEKKEDTRGRDTAVATTSAAEDEAPEMSSMAKPMEEIVPNPDAVAPPIEEIKDSETLLKEFFKDVSDAKRDAEVERVLSSFKLNPYEFLKLHFDCEMKEIPRAYRKLSLLVHPDKCKHKDAKAAFDALGQAQKLLLDEDFKRALDFNLQQARDSVLKNWKKEAREDAVLRVKYQGNKEGMFEDFCKTDEFHERWKYEARNYIVDLEWRRRKLALRIKGEEKRVTEEEKAEAAQRRQEYKEKKEWEREDKREERVSGWRDFMKGKKAKKSKFTGEFKPPSLKTETNAKDKKAYALEKDRVLRPDELKKAF